MFTTMRTFIPLLCATTLIVACNPASVDDVSDQDIQSLTQTSEETGSQPDSTTGSEWALESELGMFIEAARRF